MSPDDIRLILHRLDEQDAHFERQDVLLREIRNHTEITNGRVSKLELWQARIGGVHWAFSWLPTVLTGVITAVVVYAITSGP